MSKLSSLKFLRCTFLPLCRGPHPIWISCTGSTSSVHAATVHAKLLCGTYRSNALIGRWSGESTSCTLEGCEATVGDASHLLSGECPALHEVLVTAVTNRLRMLLPFPDLHNLVCSALARPPLQWVSFVMDPGTNFYVIPYKQEHGLNAILPLYKFNRTYMWAMHRTHFRLKGLSCYLK